MTENTLLSLAGIIILGIAAQWLAWRFHLPSILLMLLLGFLVGPVSGLLDPDAVLGPVLFPFVSLSVAIILFEGGLSLKLRELGPIRDVVMNLVTIGAVITWGLTTWAAYVFLDLTLPLALLFGAILVVSGPTVIIPLLIQVRPIGKVGPVIKWEGIVNDPVGAVLAVLVFEALRSGGFQEARNQVLAGLFNTILIGTAFGLLGAIIIVILLRYYWVPDFLQNPVALTIVLGAFTVSNIFQVESGLITVTLMGVILANQKYVSIKHIIEFKENLRVLLISALFIILSARLNLNDLAYVGFNSLIFLGVLIFVIRPAAVLLSTLKSGLHWNERLFLSWMAPRGIVAAAVSSIFALELLHIGYAGAEHLAPLVFLVIIGTVTVYGLTAMPVGRWLKVTQPDPQGVLMAGAHNWAREIAQLLKGEGFTVLLIDANQANIEAAHLADLPALQANIMSDYLLDDIELVGIGRLLALTSNDEVNALAVLHFRELFERAELYQLSPKVIKGTEAISRPLQGRLLFGRGITYSEFSRRFVEGAKIEKVTLTDEFDYADFQAFYEDKALPLFLITETGDLFVFTVDQELTPQPGQTLISLVDTTMANKLSEAMQEGPNLKFDEQTSQAEAL